MAEIDTIIVGGGIMGSSVALELAKAGRRPLVLERSVPGAEASSVAAGILGPAIEADEPGPGLSLGLASRELHRALADELRSEHGIDVGFRRCGVMRVALEESEISELDHYAGMLENAAIPHERIDGAEARKREPSLSATTAAAVDLPEEAQVDPRALLRGLAIAAERAGATYRSGSLVREVVIEDGRARGVVVGGERIEAETVVVAAGSWTSLVPGLELAADAIHPVRGQIVACNTRPPVFGRIVFGAGGYVLCRPDGRVLCGSTMEKVGFKREVTFGGLAKILRMACRVAPSLEDAAIDGHWSSFRPGTPDGLPLVGAAGAEGLILASGHYRNGILLAPVTARMVGDIILARPTRQELTALDPTRFRAARVDS